MQQQQVVRLGVGYSPQQHEDATCCGKSALRQSQLHMHTRWWACSWCLSY